MHQVVDRMAAALVEAPTGRAKAMPARGKHISGYFGPEVTERFALLRARLNMDNSELIELAIADLWRKHSSKVPSGD